MSSLDAGEGELLSLGWVPVNDGAIHLEGACQHLVRPTRSVGQSAAIHQLRDCELTAAEDPATVLQRLLAAAAGRVLVFHNAVLDLAFLDALSRRQFGAPVLLPAIDTMLQERALLERRGRPVQPGELRLQACRDRYNLPRYPPHNALFDALATAELLLALAAHRSRGSPLPLRRLL